VAGPRDPVIAGVYQSKQGDLSAQSQQDLYFEVAKGALADAGLALKDVDGLIGDAPDGVGIRSLLPGAALADLIGRPLRFEASTHIGAAACSAGVGLAALAVESGIADVVLVPTAAAGIGGGPLGNDRDKAIEAMAKLGSPYEWLWGTTRVADYAVIQRRHMHEYGTTSRQLAEIAVAQRRGATLHPLSAMGVKGEISIDDVLNSRMIADPIRLLECCPVNQGGGAVVVTTAERARDLKTPAIRIIGWGEGHGYLDPNSAPSLTAFAGKEAADTAFCRAGVSRGDVNVVGMSDHFTINVLIGLEDAGFCKKGEGGAFVENGALAIDGRLPTNTSGGFLSFSHAGSCGLFTMIEVVEQLRGSAGPRQVNGAAIGYVHGMGGVFQTHYAALLAKD